MQFKSNKPIVVTVPSLSSIDEFTEILKSAWDSRILTHNGPLVQRLEKEVNAFLNTSQCVAVTNGTVALQLAIKAYGLIGEIITTPFSWIATASAINWEQCTPVFVDIDPETFNIDPSRIEAAITPNTCAIMPVHVFSNPADIDAIEVIAKKHNLKVIYDAAHAFAVNYKGKTVMEYGDISCTSFHATKIFNSGEGGACFTKDFDIFKKLQRLRFFGHDDSKEITDDGMNGKMTEIHSAIGLANLKYVNEVIRKRKEIFSIYKTNLEGLDGIKFQKFNADNYNYSYMPVVFKSEDKLSKIISALNTANVFPRRYFNPSLNTIKYLNCNGKMPFSEDLALRIVCLPSHNDLDFESIHNICDLIKNNY